MCLKFIVVDLQKMMNVLNIRMPYKGIEPAKTLRFSRKTLLNPKQIKAESMYNNNNLATIIWIFSSVNHK
jgi:hypothetical protein